MCKMLLSVWWDKEDTNEIHLLTEDIKYILYKKGMELMRCQIHHHFVIL